MSRFAADVLSRKAFAAISLAALAAIGVGGAVVAPAPASAHRAPGLSARILNNHLTCDPLTYPFCTITGDVRVANNRARGTGLIQICVGIRVHTAGHRDLSIEAPSAAGQAIVNLRPARARITRFRAVYDDSAGLADHVHVVHVHKSTVSGGQAC